MRTGRRNSLALGFAGRICERNLIDSHLSCDLKFHMPPVRVREFGCTDVVKLGKTRLLMHQHSPPGHFTARRLKIVSQASLSWSQLRPVDALGNLTLAWFVHLYPEVSK